MSDNSVLATPNTARLSVTRTFMSAPSRDLIIRLAPSTLSMVPRIRTVGGCCAHAEGPSTDMIVSEATSARGSNEEIFGMALSLPIFPGKEWNTVAARLFLLPLWEKGRKPTLLHRRRQPGAADADAVGFVGTVRQLFHGRDHLGAGLQLGFVGGDIGHHRRFRRNHDFLLALLVFDQQGVTVIAGDGLGHRRIGHGAVGAQIERPRSLAGTA